MRNSATTTDGMAAQPAPGGRARQVVALSRPRYEVLPLAGVADEVQEHIPRECPVTVTASPRRGLEPTMALTEELARRGFAAVPHLAARQVRDVGHLRDLWQRFQQIGVEDVFVVAGDAAQPVGDFPDSLAMLAAIHRLQGAGAMPTLARLGIACYPEGHPLVGEQRLWRALLDKQAMATYVVSQMCFDARAVLAWADRAGRSGSRLPLHAGIPGAVDRRRLLRVAGRIGVGESLRFLERQHGLGRMLRPGGYRPDQLVAELLPGEAALPAAVSGLHIYTLGDIAGTECWRRRLLERLTREAGND